MQNPIPGIEDAGTITAAFDQRAAAAPASIAVSFGERDYTYHELDARANQLAGQLQELGVGPDSLVGIFLNRSPEMVIALLAVLKAGGAYVPLDPLYPRERIALLIDDSQAAVILTDRRSAGRLPEGSARVVLLDVAEPTKGSNASPLRVCPAKPHHLAYVIYTSGSTGQPKGVMLEHRNVMSFFAAMDPILGVTPGVWLAVTSICFDISVLELLWTLTRGFHVVLHGDEGIHTIAAEMKRHSVTHFQATPSMARMLVSDPAALAALGTLDILLLGGEALPVSLVTTLQPTVSGKLINIYGPTETTIWSTSYTIPGDAQFRASVPIGRPLTNTSAYLLDADRRPVPEGDSGELYLGGQGVARGYWQRADLTNERFMPDPWVAGGRMYRTGDVARRLPTGEIEFLGRTDFQVKLRGHRIELGEIETLLEQQPSVRAAVVNAFDFARPGRAEDKRLVAYVVPSAAEAIDIAALRTDLGTKLPDFMVPSHFVVLAELPLTANGKIDRKSLPKPEFDRAPAVVESTLPHDTMQQVIERVWAESLGLPQVGIDENVMDLGASSLMMPEVQMELQRRLGKEISLVDLFEFHTVRTLAKHLAGDLAGDQAVTRISSRAELRRAARKRGRSA